MRTREQAREAAKKWRKLHPGYDKRPYRNTPAQKAAESRYGKSPKGRKTDAAYLRLVRRVTPDKPRARDAVKHALKIGRLVRPNHCEHCCLWSDKLHAHHPDYSQRLLVEWLCPPCHTNRHRKAA